MAPTDFMFVEEKFCRACKKVQNHQNGECTGCAAKERAEAERFWQVMSDSDKIEELRRRIERLETDRNPIR